MIVVDTNVIAALYLPSSQSRHAQQALRHDPNWAAPWLWRSEFRNVLASLMRSEQMRPADAIDIAAAAEDLLAGNEYTVPTHDVLLLTHRSRCTAYDCEFVALAQTAVVPLVTLDRAVLRAFPETAVTLDQFAG